MFAVNETMTITGELIARAERLLLPNGETFDDERRDFIRSLDKRDLMAVPGSGKTTALQAKLYCMAQQLPQADGRGILVLSHTNTAVDELKTLLQGHCPHLFEYPNFVGTIQQFVDKYLAIPFYESYYKKGIEVIDADRYCKECDKIVNRGRGMAASHVRFKFASDNKHYNQIRCSYNDAGEIYLTIGINGKIPEIKVPQTWIKARRVEENKKAIFKFLFEMKKQLFVNGILHYDDCYFLAESYLRQTPTVVETLRHRFQYVFVDEAQDTQKHQLDLLNKLFDGEPCDCFQFIGDPNQSIFSSHSRNTTLQWTGKNPRYINHSIRLTSETAKVVNNLVTDKGHEEEGGWEHFAVTGQRRLGAVIQPQMILYDQATMGRLNEKFEELIRANHLDQEEGAAKHGFHIIGWAAVKTEDHDKLHLEDIFPEYTYTSTDAAYTMDTLSKVVQNEKARDNFKVSNRIVIESFLHVLFLSEVRAEDGGSYNKTKLSKILAGLADDVISQYREDLYNCAKEIAAGNHVQAYTLLKSFITRWMQTLFHAALNDSCRAYLGDAFVAEPVAAEPVHEEGGLPIETGTIHSVKGRTHCATMYVETYYEGKYECEHLMVNKRGEIKNPLFGDDVANTGTYASMARKMMYVGFSRPTHLLCYATEKRRWTDEHLEKMREQGWNVIDLTLGV